MHGLGSKNTRADQKSRIF